MRVFITYQLVNPLMTQRGSIDVLHTLVIVNQSSKNPKPNSNHICIIVSYDVGTIPKMSPSFGRPPQQRSNGRGSSRTAMTTIRICIAIWRIPPSEWTAKKKKEYLILLHSLPYSNWQTFAHFLKASVGTGVLAMPSAFANAGYVNGIVLTVLVGVLAVYCLHILVSCWLKWVICELYCWYFILPSFRSAACTNSASNSACPM